MINTEETNKDILDEDFDGDLDAELAEVDEFLNTMEPEVALGELIDEDLQHKFDTYACTELKLILGEDKYILIQKAIDYGGDDMFPLDSIIFISLEEAVSYLKTKKLHNCPIDLDDLLLNNKVINEPLS